MSISYSTDWLPFKNDVFLQSLIEKGLQQYQTLNATPVAINGTNFLIATTDGTSRSSTLRVEYVMPDLNYDYAVPFFLGMILFELIVQFVSGRKLYRLNDSFASLACGVTQQLTGKLFTNYFFSILPYTFVYHCIYGATEGALSSSVELLDMTSLYWWFVLLFKDHQYYWAHRYMHEWNIGWGSHNPHHSSEEYNLTTALRQGLVQDVVSFFFFTPMAMCGVHPLIFAVHSNINLVGQFWFHTRAINKLPWFLEWILNTPSHHRVHHGRNEYCLDKNYGGILIVFDRLYGTFEPEQEMKEYDPIRKEKSNVVYGLTHPLTTFNPIHTQLHHFKYMWDTIKQISSSSEVEAFKGKPFWWILKNKLQIIYKGPGWNAFEQNYFECPEVLEPPSRNEMYDPHISYMDKFVATVHFILLFALNLIHMDTKFDGQPFWMHLGQYLFLYLSLASVAQIFEGSYMARKVEILRGSLMLVLLRFSALEPDHFISRFMPGAKLLSLPVYEALTVAHLSMGIYLVTLLYWIYRKNPSESKPKSE